MATISADIDLNVSKLLASLRQASDAAKTAGTAITSAFRDIQPTVDIKAEIDTTQAKTDAENLSKTLSGQLTNKPVTVAVTGDFAKVAEQAKAAGATIKNAIGDVNISTKIDTTGVSKVSKELNEATGEAKKLDNALETVDKELTGLGDKKINIGSELSEGLKGGLLGGLIGGGIAGAVTTGLAAIGEGFSATMELGKEFEQSLAGLSAITGVQGAGLADLGQRARDLAKEFGGTATSQLESFQGVLSKFGAQLADTPDQLGEVSKNINILAKAGGLDAKGAMDALTASMLQFGVNVNDANEVASESGRFINVLAKSAQVGAAEIPQVAEAILQAGVAAKGANLGFEETNAAIQVLAAGGKVGSEAGVALRNVLGLLIKQSGEGDKVLTQFGTSTAELGKILTTEGLSAALEKVSGGMAKLGSDAERSAALAQLFGSENAAAAGILLKGSGTLKDWTSQMTGTQSAVEQAATNMATFGEMIERLKSNFQDFGLTIYNAVVPVVTQIFSTLADVFSQVSGVLSPVIADIKNNFSQIFDVVKPLYALLGGAIIAVVIEAFTAFSLSIKLVSGFIAELYTGIKNALLPVFNELGNLFGEAGGKALTLSDVMEAFGGAVEFASDVVGVLAKVLAQAIIIPFQQVTSGVASAIAAFGEFASFVGNIENSVGGFVRGLLGVKDAATGATEATNQNADAVLKSAEATQKSITAQLEDNKQKQIAATGVQALVSEYQALAGKSKLTADEQKKLETIQAELDKQYPALIDQTKSFANNLNGVSEIGKMADASLKGLAASNADLQKQMEQTGKAIAGAKRDIAITALRDISETSFFEGGALTKFKTDFASVRKDFEAGLFAAKTEEDVNAAQKKIFEFFNANRKTLTDAGKNDEFLEFEAKIRGAIDATRTAVKAFSGDAKTAKTATQGLATGATDEFAALQARLDTLRSTFGNLTKTQQKEQGSIIGDAIDKALTVTDGQRKKLDDQLQAILNPKKEGKDGKEGKEKTEIELLKEKLALKRDEIQDKRKDIDLTNELALAEDGVQKADIERVKQNKAASRVRAAQEELDAAKELFKAVAEGDTFTIPVAIKGDGKERQAAVELLEDINRELKAAKFEAIKVQAEIDKEATAKNIAVLSESIKRDEKTLKETINVETALKFPDKEVFKTKVQQGLISLAKTEEGLKAKLAVAVDADIIDKITKELETIAKVREDAEKKNVEVLAKIDGQRREAEIAGIADDVQRELETKIFALEKQRDKELENEALTGAARVVIAERYQKQIDALRNKNNASGVIEAAALKFSEALQKSFTRTVTAEEKKRTAERIAELDKQSEALLQNLKSGAANYEETMNKLAELDKERAAATADNGGLVGAFDATTAALNATVAETLKTLADAQKAAAQAAFDAAKSGIDARIALERETADLEAEIDKARADGKVEREQELQARLLKIRANSEKSGNELAADAAKLQQKITEARAGGRADEEKKLTAELADVQKEQAADTTNTSAKITEAYVNVASAAALSLGEAVASGKNFGDAIAGIAFDTLNSLVPIFVAQIFGTTFATLGPILGPIATAATTGLLYGLVALAKPKCAETGAPDGVGAGYNAPRGATDTIPLWVAPGEAIINAAQSEQWRDTLRAINSGGDVLQTVFNNTNPAEIAALLRENFTAPEIAAIVGTTDGVTAMPEFRLPNLTTPPLTIQAGGGTGAVELERQTEALTNVLEKNNSKQTQNLQRLAKVFVENGGVYVVPNNNDDAVKLEKARRSRIKRGGI